MILYETKELCYLIGVGEFRAMENKVPESGYLYFMAIHCEDGLMRLGIIFEEDPGEDIILIKNQKRNKSKLFIFHRVLSYTIDDLLLVPRIQNGELNILNLDHKYLLIELTPQAEDLGLADRFKMRDVVYI